MSRSPMWPRGAWVAALVLLAGCPKQVATTDGGCGADCGPPASCDGGACGECSATAACPANLVCDLQIAHCVGCLSNADCQAPAPICDPTTRACAAGCLSNADCQAPTPICDPTTQSCAAGCLSNADCQAPTPICDPTTHSCAAGCLSNSDCHAPTAVCDPATTTCAACLVDGDCSLGNLCTTKACHPGCTTVRGCPAGQSCNPTAGTCTNCSVSTLSFTTVATRGNNTPVVVHGGYDYTPSIMHDGRYRMYWCSGMSGDNIFYSEADSLRGPWTTPVSVFHPTGVPGTFDRTHTCDPSVIRVDAVYYLYYGGLDEGESAATQTTRLGVARSIDGRNWTRLNGGQPIVIPLRPITGLINKYGAGQPSATYLDGKFYLMYTDTTGLGGNLGNGAGQYVLRSPDPTFTSQLEELTTDGFKPWSAAIHTLYSLTEAFSADIQFDDKVDAFVVAVNSGTPAPNSQPAVELRYFDRTTMKPIPGSAYIPAQVSEGPGIVGRPDRHSIPTPDCNRLRMDTLYAIGPNVNAWDLAHSGADFTIDRSCECVDFGKVYEGSLLISPNRPLAMVIDGKRLHFALSAPALRLARTSYDVPNSVFDIIPAAASLFTSAPVLSAPGKPGAFLLDDGKVYPFDCLELVTDNQSALVSVTAAEFDSHPVGSTLRCLH